MAMYPCKKHSAYYYRTATPGDVVTFDAPAALPLLDATFDITAVQSGTGDPSPSNVRPISGFTGMTIHVADGEEPHVVDNTYPVTWTSEGTLYGGYVKVNSDGSAELWKTHENVTKKWSDSISGGTLIGTVRRKSFTLSSEEETNSASISTCAIYLRAYSDDVIHHYCSGSRLYMFLPDNTSDNFEFTVVYKLATPVKVCDLPDININTLMGINNIFIDTGAVEALRYRIK